MSRMTVAAERFMIVVLAIITAAAADTVPPDNKYLPARAGLLTALYFRQKCFSEAPVEVGRILHRLLEEYRKLTGVGTLVNTSFNMHEEPIVCTPTDAVRSFVRGHLDYLVIGSYLVENPSLGPIVGEPPRRIVGEAPRRGGA